MAKTAVSKTVYSGNRIWGFGTTALGDIYGTNDDKVSGIVKFSGYAYDNKCLKELKWAIVNDPADESYASPAYLFGSDMQTGYGTVCAAVKVLNDINGTWYGVSGQTADQTEWTLTPAGQDNLLLKAGQYNVKYNAATDTATISLSEKGYFLAGVVDGADHWDCTAVNHQLEKLSDNEYVVYYTFTEADTASWIRDSGKKGAVKVTYGFSGSGADEWFGTEGSQDNMMVDSYGLYEIKLHLDGGYITAEKLEGYFLVGTIGDGDTWRAESAYFIGKEPKAITYTWKAQDPASWLGSDIAAIKVIYVDADGNVTWYGAADGNNVMIPKVGTYTITLKDGVVTAN